MIPIAVPVRRALATLGAALACFVLADAALRLALAGAVRSAFWPALTLAVGAAGAVMAARRSDRRRLALYAHFVDELPVGVAVLRLDDPLDPSSWRVIELNPAAIRLTGSKDRKVRGATLGQLSPEAIGTELPRACARALRAGRTVSIPDFEVGPAPGAHFSVRVFPLERGQVGVVFEDVTARRHAEDALRRAEEQTRLTLESVHGYAIFRLDGEGRVSTWNQGAQRALGWTPAEALGEPFARLFPPEDRAAAAALVTQAAQGRPGRREGWLEGKDGRRVWGDASVTALPAGADGTRGFVALVQDGTERRRMIGELEERTAALAKSNAELSEFAYVASHDLQAPLRKATAFAQQLALRAGPALDAEAKDFMERMLRSIEGMQALIEALLKLARVSTAKAEPQSVDLSAIAAAVVEDLDAPLRSAGGRVLIEPLPRVEADPQQMRQLLQNLVGNAVKFHDPSRPPVVRVAGRARGDGTVELQVRDEGVGFDMRYAGRLFHPFQRLHSVREFPGTGMGLAICQKIAERHGGSIAAASELGRGSTFTVTLPAPHAPAPAAEAARG